MIKLKLTLALSLFSLTHLNAQWEMLNAGTAEELNDIDFIDENVGWISGDNGILYKINDGGESWHLLPENKELHIRHIDFVNELVGWAIGVASNWTLDQDAVLRTTNAGLTWVENDNKTFPTKFVLEQNYPNPFSAKGGSASGGNPTTKIKYSVPSVTLRQAQSDIHVTLKVYDVLGREVATLVDEEKRPGLYEVEWNGSDKPSGVSSKGGYASGVYFYKIQVGNCTAVRKMLLLR